MFWERILQGTRWIWERFDTILALLLGVICSILGLLSILPSSILASTTLATLTILAFSLMRDRDGRERLQRQIFTLTEQTKKPDLDVIFYEPLDEGMLLQSAEKEIWLIQETSLYIVESKLTLLISFLQHGGVLRIVVANPKDTVIRQLAFRNNDFSYSLIASRARLMNHLVDRISKEASEQSENMQIRYNKHIIGANYVLADPVHTKINMRRVAVRYPGFRIPFQDRTGLMIQGQTSPKLVHYFHVEAQNLFTFASKIVLLQGSSQMGKTATIMNLLSMVPEEDQLCLCTIVLPRHQSVGVFTGYELVTNFGCTAQDVALQQHDGTYKIDSHIWDQVIVELERARTAKRVVVIDELIPPLLQDPRLTTILDKMVDDPSMSLFATFSLEQRNNAFIQKLRLHPRSTVLRLSTDMQERSTTEQLLERELLAAVFVAKNELTRGKKK